MYNHDFVLSFNTLLFWRTTLEKESLMVQTTICSAKGHAIITSQARLPFSSIWIMFLLVGKCMACPYFSDGGGT